MLEHNSLTQKNKNNRHQRLETRYDIMGGKTWNEDKGEYLQGVQEDHSLGNNNLLERQNYY